MSALRIVMASFSTALVLAVCALSAAQPAAAKSGQVTVDIVGFKSDRGRAFVALYRGPDGFPNKPNKAFARKIVSIRERRVRVVFDAVPAGELAVSMIHDENGNDEFDTNFVGIPKEGWGTSRDAKAGFGPPSYADAVLKLAAGERKRIVVHVQY